MTRHFFLLEKMDGWDEGLGKESCLALELGVIAGAKAFHFDSKIQF